MNAVGGGGDVRSRAKSPASAAGREAPASLWRFGWAGWTAVAVGAGLLTLHARGVPLFYHLMRATSDAVGWTVMTRLMIALYAGLDLFEPWTSLYGLAAGPNPLFTAGLGVGLVLGQTRRRWAVFAACVLVSVGIRGLPFGVPGVFTWWANLVGVVVNRELASELWFQLPLVVMAPLACWSLRSWRPAVWFAVFGAAGFAVERVSSLPGLRPTDPALVYAIPALRWLWLAAWWWRCVAWGVRERRALVRREGLCPGCEYDLAGLPKGPCPECGRAPDDGPGGAGQQPCSKAVTKSS